MTRVVFTTAFAAALAAAAVLASPQIPLAAKGGFKGFHAVHVRPVPFRANGLFGPITPKTLSHTGLPEKFHGHHSKHIVQPVIVGLTGGGLVLLNRYPLADMPPDQAPVRPALVPVGGSLGCVTEDVGVSGGTVSIIRC